MSVKFNVVPRKNPQNREAAPKFYATLNAKDKRDLRNIAERIAVRSTLNEMDVLAVLEGLVQTIPLVLNDGYSVVLGDFGAFHITCKSAASELEEDVTSSNIEKVNIQFRPGKLVKYTLNNMEFTKLS